MSLQVYDQKSKRFEVPIETPSPDPAHRPKSPDYKATLAKDVFGIKVTRADDTSSVL